MKKLNKNSIEYKQGFIEGYSKAVKDLRKIKRESAKITKPIKETIRKLCNI